MIRKFLISCHICYICKWVQIVNVKFVFRSLLLCECQHTRYESFWWCLYFFIKCNNYQMKSPFWMSISSLCLVELMWFYLSFDSLICLTRIISTSDLHYKWIKNNSCFGFESAVPWVRGTQGGWSNCGGIIAFGLIKKMVSLD